MRRPSWVVRVILSALSVLLPSPVLAQHAFLSGDAGVYAGTGGPAPAFAVSTGYVTASRLGFELEFAAVPSLDFGTRSLSFPAGVPLPSFGFDLPSITWPSITSSTTGRLLLLETHAIVTVVDRPRLHVSAQAGGGVASLRATVRVHQDAFEVPEFPMFTIPARDTTTSRTDSGLSLEAGGTFEYMLSARVGVGATARYGHAFTDRALDYVRTTGRVTLRF